MAYNKKIEKIILEDAKQPFSPLTAHILTLEHFSQEEVRSTAQKLIDAGQIKAWINFQEGDLCAIIFK